MKYKFLILCMLSTLLPIVLIGADWEVKLIITNHGASGNQLQNWAYFGESETALEGYDWQNDAAYLYPPMSGSYVVPYFTHSDWGVNNGNFSRDVRSRVPALKIWNTTVKAQNRISNNYTLSWEIIGSIPAYYTPVLVFGQQNVNLRQQSSFSYASAAALTNFTIRLDYNSSIPYSLSNIEDLQFSNNQTQRINLSRYFAVGSGSLSYAYSENEHLVQDIVAERDSTYWELHPIPGYSGNTSVQISAAHGTYSTSQTVAIERDSTNSPPIMSQELPILELTQNQSILWNWAGLFEDPDLDSLWIELAGSELITAVPGNTDTELLLIPAAGLKGDLDITILVHDGANEPIMDALQLTILPSEPQAVQNIEIYQNEESALICSWASVTLDISGSSAPDIVYDVYVYEDLSPSSEAALVFSSLESTSVMIPSTLSRAFIVIIAINE